MSVEQFFQKLDEYFGKNQIKEAGEFLEKCLVESRKTGDLSLEISVLNEMMGYYRSTDQKEKGLQSVEDGIRLIRENGLDAHPSLANMWINMGTTLCHFERVDEAEICYKNAEQFILQSATGALEMASLYNNTAAIYVKTNRIEEAQERYGKALEYLKTLEKNTEFWEDVQFNRIVTWLNIIVMNRVKEQKNHQDTEKEIQKNIKKIKEVLSLKDFQKTESFPYAVKKCSHCFENLGERENQCWVENLAKTEKP